MHFMRNPEVRWVFWPDLLIAIASGVLLYRFAQNGAPPKHLALLAAASFALMGIVFLVVSGLHAKKVQRFIQRIDKNLHGNRDLQFDDCRNDDFSKLQSTVKKMVEAHFQQESLLQTEKERLVTELAMIAHEINTPLQVISLNTEQLADADQDPMLRRLTAHRTLDLVERIKVFVQSLLRLSRLEANVVKFRKETFTAKELIDRAVAPLVLSIELRDQTLEMNVPDDILIESDLFWLSDALVNVVKNCMEHTPNGGRIEINVSRKAADTRITIRDTGPGIPPEELPRIFERYHKGKDSSSKSIGIGLTFTRRVIHDLNGSIRAENHPDGGALFTIQLYSGNA